MADNPNLHDWGPLVDDVRWSQADRARHGWRRARRPPARARQAARPRANRPAARSRARSSSTDCSPTTWTRPWPTRIARRRRRRHRASARSTGGGLRSSPTTSPCWPARWARSASRRRLGCASSCLRQRIPIVWLLDSGGARIHSTSGSTFAGAGALFREQVTLSGVVPQVGAMLGHCAAGTAYIPALTDFVPMVKGTSSMALGGRHLVKAATGEDVTEEEMGGSEVHNKVSGVADQEVASDDECLAMVRHYLSFFLEQHRSRAAGRRRATIRSTVVAKSCTTSSRRRLAARTTCTRSSRPSSTTATSSR